MAFTSTGLLSLLDYQVLNLGTAAPNDGETLDVAAPKIVSNFATLFALTAASPQRVAFWAKPFGTTFTSVAATVAAIGTAENATQNVLVGTDHITVRQRRGYTTDVVAGVGAGLRLGASAQNGYRATIPGAGGFVHRVRFSLKSIPNAAFKFFAGSTDGNPPNAGDEPTAYTNCVGLGKNTADNRFYIIYNDNTGTASKIALDPTLFPITAGTMYEVVISSAPGANSSVAYRVRTVTGLDADGNDVFGNTTSGELTTDLPVAYQYLSPLAYINNGANASAFIFNIFSFDGIRL